MSKLQVKTKMKGKNKGTQTDFIPQTTQNIFILSGLDDNEREGSDPDYLPYGPDEYDEDDEGNKLKRGYTRDDSEYYEGLTKKHKKRVDKMEEDINKVNFFTVPMRFRILESNIDTRLKQLAIQKVDELSSMFPGSGEYYKLKTWIETLCKLPIGIFKRLPVSKNDNTQKLSLFMEKTKQKFDELVYGHGESKTQIIQLLAKLISNPTANGIVIGLQGHPGVGKTEISKVLGEVLDMPLGFISLAGVDDEHVFRGFSPCYESSHCGRIAEILMKAKCMNPILYFDELDKISTSKHGEAVANFMIHLTDYNQNHKFQDNFFSDIDLDLSKCIFIFSYNNESLISPILKDRMVTIRVKGYTVKDKLKLAQKYMLPKIYKEYGFDRSEINMCDEDIEYVISKVDQEQGVRNMKRGFEEIIGTLNYEKLLGKISVPVQVNKKVIDEHLLINKKKEDVTSKNMMYL